DDRGGMDWRRLQLRRHRKHTGLRHPGLKFRNDGIVRQRVAESGSRAVSVDASRPDISRLGSPTPLIPFFPDEGIALGIDSVKLNGVLSDREDESKSDVARDMFRVIGWDWINEVEVAPSRCRGHLMRHGCCFSIRKFNLDFESVFGSCPADSPGDLKRFQCEIRQ